MVAVVEPHPAVSTIMVRPKDLRLNGRVAVTLPYLCARNTLNFPSDLDQWSDKIAARRMDIPHMWSDVHQLLAVPRSQSR